MSPLAMLLQFFILMILVCVLESMHQKELEDVIFQEIAEMRQKQDAFISALIHGDADE